jgi:hypothetical protein
VLTTTLSNIGSVSINEPLPIYLITERAELKVEGQPLTPPEIYRVYGKETKMFNLAKIANMYVGSVEQFDIGYRVKPISAKHDEFRCQIRVSSNGKHYVFPFLFEMR